MRDVDALKTHLLYRFADEADVRRMQGYYAQLFAEAGCRRVLDLGAGRGLFLELLRGQGIEAVGVDGSAEVVAEVRARGFEMHHADVLSFLREAQGRGERFDGVFCSHLIEHLPGEVGVELVTLLSGVVAPRGRLILVTPNIAQPLVASKVFWLDLTHVRPYPRLLLEAMLSATGFRVVRSFDDRRTLVPYGRSAGSMWGLVKDVARYGFGALTGMDAVVVADRE